MYSRSVSSIIMAPTSWFDALMALMTRATEMP